MEHGYSLARSSGLYAYPVSGRSSGNGPSASDVRYTGILVDTEGGLSRDGGNRIHTVHTVISPIGVNQSLFCDYGSLA